MSGASGGVGGYAIQLAAARGATVIATAKSGEQADFVRDLGAAHVVDYTGDVAGQVRAMAHEGVDAVLHFAGDPVVLADLLVPGGRLTSTLGSGPDALSRPDAIATTIWANPDRPTLDRLAGEVAAGRLRVPVTRTYPLAEVPQALADFAASSVGKLAVTLQEESCLPSPSAAPGSRLRSSRARRTARHRRRPARPAATDHLFAAAASASVDLDRSRAAGLTR